MTLVNPQWRSANLQTSPLDLHQLQFRWHSKKLVMSKNAVDLLMSDYQRLEEWCSGLEEIADALPDIDQAQTSRALHFAKQNALLHFRDFEERLIPLLKKRVSEDHWSVLTNVSEEHVKDECLVYELLEIFERFDGRRSYLDPNALGFFLRSLFEIFRRHTTWEKAIILPLAQRHLSSNDITNLLQVMMQFRDDVNAIE